MANNGASPFEILVSTLLSLRTRDEVTMVASKKLFEYATTPEAIIALGEVKIEKLIYPVGFYPTKAKRLVEISRILKEHYNSNVPDDIDELLKLPGVGRKTANLVITEGHGKIGVCVDTHVHRISNRTGYVNTTTADKTEFALRDRLPKEYWIIYNEILVAFGQVLCRPISPFCSKCPVFFMCAQKGVTTKR
jgi:endonuclease-3